MITSIHNVSRILVLSVLVMCSDLFAADIDWGGWSFDYSVNDSDSGLVLQNVEFNGKKILYRAGMPVMRVEYDNDACGPYADILTPSVLEPAYSGAPNNACDGQSVCTRTYTQNGQQMLEVGSNWQIGEYQIYQTYYFSDEGYFDARIYSRGLQCEVTHRHHAHWFFDFDIGDENNDRVLRGSQEVRSVEFNDLTSQTGFWTIEDTQTGDQIRLIPSNDDGSPDGFAQWDAAARRYRSGEVGRWRFGARGEIGNRFMSPAENINGQDIVFWYVSHLPHAASEGAGIWHASGPRIQVVTDNLSQQPEPAPEPEPEPEPTPDPANLLVNGGFESNLTAWSNCGDSNNLSISNSSSSGARALSVSDGGCLYQVTEATSGYYSFSCDTSQPGYLWSAIGLYFLDDQYNVLASDFRQVATGGGGYSALTVAGNSVANTSYALALVYSEDQTLFDNCSLTGGLTPRLGSVLDTSGEVLSNGEFEDGLADWTSCGTDGLAVVADEGDGSSAALQSLTAPENGRLGSLVLYSEQGVTFDRCSVVRN